MDRSSKNLLAEIRSAETPVWRQWGNSLDFALREFVHRNLQTRAKTSLARKAFLETAEDKAPLFVEGAFLRELRWLNRPYRFSEPQQNRLNRLIESYQLNGFYERTTRLRLLEALSILDYLDQCNKHYPLITSQDDCLYWLDVGSKNWAYVDAQWAFLMRHWLPANLETNGDLRRSFCLDGVELDAYRRYRDGYHRADYAASYIQSLPENSQIQVSYHADDIRYWEPAHSQLAFNGYHVISCFLPFVFADPHFAWGLPKSHFDPQAVMRRMIRLLADNGTLMLTNQGAEEAEAQQSLLIHTAEGLDGDYRLDILSLGELPESFLPLQYPRYGYLCRKIPL